MDSTFVMPLPGGTTSNPTRETYSLNNQDHLIEYINSNHMVQQMLAIDEIVNYGVYRDVFNDYYVVADLSHASWGDILDRPGIDVLMKEEWGKWSPGPEDWKKFHYYIRTQLAIILASSLDWNPHPNSFVYSVRRNGPKAKVYKVSFG